MLSYGEFISYVNKQVKKAVRTKLALCGVG
jgi:hypothetical protein